MNANDKRKILQRIIRQNFNEADNVNPQDKLFLVKQCCRQK